MLSLPNLDNKHYKNKLTNNEYVQNYAVKGTNDV